MSFNVNKSHTLTLSLGKDHLANLLIYFLKKFHEEVQSLKHLDLTISQDLGQTAFLKWPPKTVVDWASFVM